MVALQQQVLAHCLYFRGKVDKRAVAEKRITHETKERMKVICWAYFNSALNPQKVSYLFIYICWE